VKAKMHGSWIALSASEGKPIYRRGRILLSLKGITKIRKSVQA